MAERRTRGGASSRAEAGEFHGPNEEYDDDDDKSYSARPTSDWVSAVTRIRYAHSTKFVMTMYISINTAFNHKSHGPCQVLAVALAASF